MLFLVPKEPDYEISSKTKFLIIFVELLLKYNVESRTRMIFDIPAAVANR